MEGSLYVRSVGWSSTSNIKNVFIGFFKKMGQTRPHFVYFCCFHIANIAQIL